MNPSGQLKFLASILFDSFHGPLLLLLGLIMSVALSLWTQSLGKRLYLLFVIVGSAPLVAYIFLPLAVQAANKSNGLAYVILWLYSAHASPFAVGVVLGALLAPVLRWGLSTGQSPN